MSEADRPALVEEFNRAWIEHDLDAALALVTDDRVFDNTTPAPDGERFQGKAAIRAAWQPVFDNPRSQFKIEEVFTVDDRGRRRRSSVLAGSGGGRESNPPGGGRPPQRF